MRLAFPRINSLEADDGSASISYLTVDMNRDTGGLKYNFTSMKPFGKIDIPTTVALLTSSKARDLLLAETGFDIFDQDLSEIERRVREYAGQHGHTFEVRTFQVPATANEQMIRVLRDSFCDLFLEYWSAYRNSSGDHTDDSAGRYPDTLHFRPQNLNRKFHVTLHAKGGAG
ncbi:amidophosphoribosyltransferase [Bradyrhizobium oligotrophicum S58]|uniref:Amidophosphoribosyltransferase n=1 Tax=Bradyrhizobium oligotrophicum S58 TaxID=1245469 RepID=M4Z6J0_9BRAD|nr:hypothetical protein [Bradyrhizobium oligotrophicum]BAM89148.1 amidophosphoribosyltransferase [Bradyrhizobium oligotrophicum S58]